MLKNPKSKGVIHLAGSHLAPNSSSPRSNRNSSNQDPKPRAGRHGIPSDVDEEYDDLDFDLDNQGSDNGDYEDDQDYDQDDDLDTRRNTRQRSRSSRRERDYRDYDEEDDDYDEDDDYGYNSYHGHDRHSDGNGGSGKSGKGKTILLVALLIIVVGAIIFLLLKLFGPILQDKFGRQGGGQNNPPAAEVGDGITTQVTAEYENGKSLSKNMTVTEGTERPEELADSEDAILLDVQWTGGKAPAEPIYITVSDPSFPDDEGLAVYNFTEDGTGTGGGEWTLVGNYAIRDHSVTFRTEDPSALALSILRAEPSPSPTPMITMPPATPTPAPSITPSPTPAPVKVVDYGGYSEEQSGVFAQVQEIEDENVYVMAVVRNMPAGSSETANSSENGGETGTEGTTDTGESTEGSEDGMTISYVDANETGTPVPETAAPAASAAPAGEYTGPVASVLINLDGTNMRTMDMHMFQAEDGTWCLDGQITAGMLWTSNRDIYGGESRYSLCNNEAYLNLADDGQTMILNDNSVKTRFLIENAEMADGTELQTITYADSGRHYINSMEMTTDTITAEDFPAVDESGNGSSDDDTPGQTIPSGSVLYVGSGVMPESDTVSRDVLQFTVSDNSNDSLQIMLFKLNESIQAPAASTMAASNRIIVPPIDETTNLSFLEVRDGDTILQNGVDYTINVRVYNNNVIVTIQFMGNYSGQVVRTYPGTKVLCNDIIEEPSPSPEPTESPAPTQASAPPQSGGTGGQQQAQPSNPGSGGPDSGTDTATPAPGSTPVSSTDTQPTP